MKSIPFISIVLILIALFLAATFFFEKLVTYLMSLKKGSVDTSNQPQLSSDNLSSTTQSTPSTKVREERSSLLGVSHTSFKSTSQLVPDSTADQAVIDQPYSPTFNNPNAADENHTIESKSTAYESGKVNGQHDDNANGDGTALDDEIEDDIDDDFDDDFDESQEKLNTPTEDGEEDDFDDDFDDSALDDDTSPDDKPNVIVSQTFSHSSDADEFSGNGEWDSDEDILLDVEEGGFTTYDLAKVLEEEDEPEGVRLETYLGRVQIIKTALFDIGRISRKRAKKQTVEDLGQRLISMINHYKMNADKNVGNLIRAESEQTERKIDNNLDIIQPEAIAHTAAERVAFFFKLQNALISGQLDSSEPDEEL